METANNFESMTIEALGEWCTLRYTEIALKEKQLEEGKKILFELMTKANQDEVSSPFGRFYKKVVTSWKMPEDVVELKKKLTEAEEIAKAEGRAEKVEKFTYSYGALKKGEF